MTEGGLSLAEITRRGWQNWGYASFHTAYSSIRQSLILDGLYTPADRCTCGCDYDDRTWGCLQCRERHTSRRRRGAEYVTYGKDWHRQKPCARCRCHPDDRTPGCDACRWRHAARRYYRSRLAA